MKTAPKIFLFAGLGLVIYSLFSRFYGEPSIAMKMFTSMGVLNSANTLILISIGLNQLFKE